MWDCAEKMKLCDSASARNSVGPVHGNTELSFARYLLKFYGWKMFFVVEYICNEFGAECYQWFFHS